MKGDQGKVKSDPALEEMIERNRKEFNREMMLLKEEKRKMQCEIDAVKAVEVREL